MGVGPTSNSVLPGPGSRRDFVQWVRFRPPRQRYLRYILMRARSTCRYMYSHFSSLARHTSLTDSLLRGSERLVHLAGSSGPWSQISPQYYNYSTDQVRHVGRLVVVTEDLTTPFTTGRH
jgi:hypothetical protein